MNASHILLWNLLSVIALMAGCGGGGSSASGPSPAPQNGNPSTTSSTPMVDPTSISSYTCDTAATTSSCADSIYAFKRTLNETKLRQHLERSYSSATAANGELMSCKPSAACSGVWGSGLTGTQVQAMQRASTAVVRLAMPNDDPSNGQSPDLNIGSSCSGVVVRGTIDTSVYVLTAAHCLYAGALYPNMRYNSYRDAGVPVYVTFFYEKPACGGAMNFASFGPLTVGSIVVAYNYSLNGYSAPDFKAITGGVTDFAILKLTEPLPAGVFPVTQPIRKLLPTDKLFTFSHPFGLDKVGGVLDRGADFATSTPFQYHVGASTRLTEEGSSGGPLFAYDPSTGAVTVLAVQSGAGPGPSAVNTCATPQSLTYARLDGHSEFLKRYLGQ